MMKMIITYREEGDSVLHAHDYSLDIVLVGWVEGL